MRGTCLLPGDLLRAFRITAERGSALPPPQQGTHGVSLASRPCRRLSTVPFASIPRESSCLARRACLSDARAPRRETVAPQVRDVAFPARGVSVRAPLVFSDLGGRCGALCRLQPRGGRYHEPARNAGFQQEPSAPNPLRLRSGRPACRPAAAACSAPPAAMAAFGTAFGAAANSNPNKDLEVPNTPSDSISSLKFSPASNLMVATSWSGQVGAYSTRGSSSSPRQPLLGLQVLRHTSTRVLQRCWRSVIKLPCISLCNPQVLCWDVQATGQAIPKAAITSDKPVMCSAWSADGSTVFAGAREAGAPRAAPRRLLT